MLSFHVQHFYCIKKFVLLASAVMLCSLHSFLFFFIVAILHSGFIKCIKSNNNNRFDMNIIVGILFSVLFRCRRLSTQLFNKQIFHIRSLSFLFYFFLLPLIRNAFHILQISLKALFHVLEPLQ